MLPWTGYILHANFSRFPFAATPEVSLQLRYLSKPLGGEGERDPPKGSGGDGGGGGQQQQSSAKIDLHFPKHFSIPPIV